MPKPVQFSSLPLLRMIRQGEKTKWGWSAIPYGLSKTLQWSSHLTFTPMSRGVKVILFTQDQPPSVTEHEKIIRVECTQCDHHAELKLKLQIAATQSLSFSLALMNFDDATIYCYWQLSNNSRHIDFVAVSGLHCGRTGTGKERIRIVASGTGRKVSVKASGRSIVS